MESSKRVLIDCMGSQGYEALEKSIIRLKTNSTVDALETYLPLLVVPRTILSWLVQNVLPLKIGEYKEMKFPGQEDTTILVEKLDSDVYRGEFSKSGKVFHRFNHQTLPAISGHLMTIFELYHDLDEDDLPQSSKPSFDMVSHIMAQNNIPTVNRSTLDQENVRDLIAAVGKMVDVFVAQNLAAKPEIIVEAKLEPMKEDKELKQDLKDHQKKIEEKPVEVKKEEKLCVTPKSGYFRKKIAGIKKAGFEGHSGAAQPQSPKPPTPAVAQSNNPKNQMAQQLKAAGKDKTPKPMGAIKTPGASVSGPKAPTAKPQGVKPMALKSEGYFRGKLTKVAKSEHFCAEDQLYNECSHCGKPEFVKTESGPVYQPCVCYRATGKDFVALKKSENGYRLSFNSDDQDSIRSFLKTLRK